MVQRLDALIKDQSGLAGIILAPFLIFSIALGVLAWTAVGQVQSAQRQTEAALAYTLRVAAIDGTTTLPDGALLVSEPVALTAAQGAVPMALPVTLAAPTADGATYTPTSSAPVGWGTLTLSGLTVGNPAQAAGGTVCYGSAVPSSSCAYVEATLTLPYAVSLFGYPLRLSYTVTETQVVNTYDRSTQTYQ